MRQKTWMKELMRFVVVGVLATLLHYGIYYGLMLLINVSVAYTIGYVLSFVVNFYLTSYFTFRKGPTWSRLAGMGGAHAVNYALHMLLLYLFLWIGVSKEWAPLPVYAVAVPVNFLLVRFVFRGPGKSAATDRQG